MPGCGARLTLWQAKLRAARDVVRCLVEGAPLPMPLCFTTRDESEQQLDARRYCAFNMTDNVANGGHRVRAGPSLSAEVLGLFLKDSRVVCESQGVDKPDGRWLRLKLPITSRGWKPHTVAPVDGGEPEYPHSPPLVGMRGRALASALPGGRAY